MRAISPSALLITFLVLPVLGFALLACNANPVATARPTPSVSKSTVLFKAPEAVVALAADGEENVYALTVGGTLLKVTPGGKPQELAAGLQNCGFSFPALAVLPDSSLVTNDCVDNKDTLVRIDQAGSKATLRQLDQNIESIAADGTGTVYLGAWSSMGNLTVNFQPSTYLAAAEQLDGQYVAEAEDNRLARGRLALGVQMANAGDTAAFEFDNFELRGPTAPASMGALSKQPLPTSLP